MHLKNWSLIYRDRRMPELSPAYDFVATLPYIAEDKLALTFRRESQFAEISAEQVRRFAETARLPVSPLWRMITEIVDRTVEAWKGLEEKQLLPDEMRTQIDKQIVGVASRFAIVTK